MGFLNKEKSGIHCEPQEDGSMSCTPFKAKNGNRFATGTQVNISMDKSCNPTYQGSLDLMDDDEEYIDKVAKRMQKACRNGLA